MASYAKTKGNRYENAQLKHLRECFDEVTYRVHGSGSGQDDNDLVCPIRKVEFEVKNQKQWSMVSYLKQLDAQKTISESHIKALLVRDPAQAENKYNQAIVALRLEDFIKILNYGKENTNKGNQA